MNTKQPQPYTVSMGRIDTILCHGNVMLQNERQFIVIDNLFEKPIQNLVMDR